MCNNYIILILNWVWIKSYVTCSDIFTCNDSIGGCHSWDDMLHHTLTETNDTKQSWLTNYFLNCSLVIWHSWNMPFPSSPWVNLYVTPCMLKLSALSLALSQIHWTWAGSSPSTGTPSEIKFISSQFFCCPQVSFKQDHSWKLLFLSLPIANIHLFCSPRFQLLKCCYPEEIFL